MNQPLTTIGPGTILKEKYRIEERLGVGGMAEVFRARNTAIDRTVAIKVLNPTLAANPEAVQRFKREAKAANRARHPNIVDVLDVDQDGDLLFIVQEYLDGEDLAARLRRGALRVDEALDILLPVAQAVAVAHGKGVIHRDLKPGNVFLARVDGELVPKILDFGISKMALTELSAPAVVARPSNPPVPGRITLAGVAMGTPYYMSPEQIRDPGSVDPRTDVWSIGIILYEALAGAMPFDADDLGELFAQIHTHEPRRLDQVVPAVPVSVARVVQRCLRVAPAERYATAAELARSLQQARIGAEDDVEPASRRGGGVVRMAEPPDVPKRGPPLAEGPPRRAAAGDATAMAAADRSAGVRPAVSLKPSAGLELELDLPRSAPPATSSAPKSSSSSVHSQPVAPRAPALPGDLDDEDDDDDPLGIVGAGLELAQAPPPKSSAKALQAVGAKPRAAATADRADSQRRVHLRQHGAKEPTLAGAYLRLLLAGLACALLVLGGGYLGPPGMAEARALLGAASFWWYGAATGALLVALVWTASQGLRLVSFSLFLAGAGLLVTTAATAAAALWIGAPGAVPSTILVACLFAGPWASSAALLGYALFALSEGRERWKQDDERLLGGLLVVAALLSAGGLVFALRRPRVSVADIQAMPPVLDAPARAVARRFAVDASGGRAAASPSSLPLRTTTPGAAVLATVSASAAPPKPP